MVKRKAEGIEALVDKPEIISIQEITMLDWYAGFALLGGPSMIEPKELAKLAFETAQEMMKEREKYL